MDNVKYLLNAIRALSLAYQDLDRLYEITDEANRQLQCEIAELQGELKALKGDK